MHQNNRREEKVLNKGSWRHREVAADDGAWDEKAGVCHLRQTWLLICCVMIGTPGDPFGPILSIPRQNQGYLDK